MTFILGYPGVYWSARLLAIVFMVGATWLTVLMLARFFRPRHILGMLRADPPKVDEIGGEFGGFKGRIRFNAQATALNVLENRMIAVEGVIERLLVITGELNREDDDPENGWAR